MGEKERGREREGWTPEVANEYARAVARLSIESEESEQI